MPVNRNALIRYRTIDKCLQNRRRKWTIENLMDACSDALYEYEGIDKPISLRTIRMDLNAMRSDKLGYNAPIIVIDKSITLTKTRITRSPIFPSPHRIWVCCRKYPSCFASSKVSAILMK
ncbi:hypothetical protein LWM68_08880 [Niabella sp. W65]|nr:hypothetical protein [Niabella sp. W65]MCH7362875.1 hypothetical protein [Niabella sp. W65]